MLALTCSSSLLSNAAWHDVKYFFMTSISSLSFCNIFHKFILKRQTVLPFEEIQPSLLVTLFPTGSNSVNYLDIVQFLHKREQHGVYVLNTNHRSLQQQLQKLFGCSAHLKYKFDVKVGWLDLHRLVGFHLL